MSSSTISTFTFRSPSLSRFSLAQHCHALDFADTLFLVTVFAVLSIVTAILPPVFLAVLQCFCYSSVVYRKGYLLSFVISPRLYSVVPRHRVCCVSFGCTVQLYCSVVLFGCTVGFTVRFGLFSFTVRPKVRRLRCECAGAAPTDRNMPFD